MKVGITFGGYAPLHQGHLDLIMRAKKENDIAIVAVCGYDNEPRGDEYDLPLMKRYRIIKNYLEDEVLKVIMVNDTKLGLDQSMSPSNWKIWTQDIYDQVDNIVKGGEYTTTWYVAEPRYVDDLHSVCSKINVVLMDRSQNPVSGTLCRKYPLKYWDKITNPFRAYFSHNILIAGTASEGKTILTRDIGKYFSLPYSYEKGRDNYDIKTDEEFTVKDFIYNIYEQRKYNEELICSPQNPGIFLSDSDNMVTLMYAYFYSRRKQFALREEEYNMLEELVDTYDQTTKWNKIFLIAPKEKPIVDDGQRYMPDSDYKIRKEFFEFLKEQYDRRGYQYEVLTGNYYENFCTIKDYIKELYKNGN